MQCYHRLRSTHWLALLSKQQNVEGVRWAWLATCNQLRSWLAPGRNLVHGRLDGDWWPYTSRKAHHIWQEFERGTWNTTLSSTQSAIRRKRGCNHFSRSPAKINGIQLMLRSPTRSILNIKYEVLTVEYGINCHHGQSIATTHCDWLKGCDRWSKLRNTLIRTPYHFIEPYWRGYR